MPELTEQHVASVDAPDPTLVEQIIDHVAAPVSVWTPDGGCVLENQAYRDLVGMPSELLRRLAIVDVVHADDVATAQAALREAVSCGESLATLRFRHADGHDVPVEWRLSRDVRAGWIVANVRDCAADRVRLAELECLLHTDGLTGLLSRAGVIDRLREQNRVRPDGGVVVALFDIDGFKTVNESNGHQIGDDVLCGVASRLRDVVPRAEAIGRFGGDEFVVVADSEAIEADELGESIEAVFATPLDCRDRTVSARASVGVCVSSGNESIDALLRNADIAMNEAKRRGGRRTCYATEQLISEWSDRQRVERELLAALGTGAFVPHFQPVTRLGTGATAGYEVLLRWVRSDGSIVPAGEFIGVAEQAGLLRFMSKEVRERAVRLAGQTPGVQIGLNISAAELLNVHVVSELDQLTRAARLDPARVMIEVTEQTALNDLDHAADVLGRLRGLGFRVALDDFGTGYSSLTYVTELPIDVVKLDRQFVRTASQSESGIRVFRALISFLRQIDLITVVEGVETEADHQLVIGSGARHGQGWFYGRPAPLEQFITPGG